MTDLLPDDTVTRKSVPLTQRDLDDIAKLRSDDAARAQLGAIARVATPDPTSSDAALLHAVLIAGLQAVRDRIDEASYEAEAADTEWWAEHRRITRRRRPSWAEDE